MEEQEVSNATAALKGLLGIEGSAQLASEVSALSVQDNEDSKPGRKKKRNNSNRKKKDVSPEQHSHEKASVDEGANNPVTDDPKQQQQLPRRSNSSHGEAKKKKQQGSRKSASTGRGGSNATEPVRDADNKAPPSKKTGGRKNGGSSSTENYAWSAFQSPPDPSALPVPAFDSAASTPSMALLSQPQEERVNQVSPASPTSNSIAVPTVDKKENWENVLVPREPESTQDYFKSEGTHPPAEETADMVSKSEDEAEVSATGVNLAAFVSQPDQARTSDEYPSNVHPAFTHHQHYQHPSFVHNHQYHQLHPSFSYPPQQASFYPPFSGQPHMMMYPPMNHYPQQGDLSHQQQSSHAGNPTFLHSQQQNPPSFLPPHQGLMQPPSHLQQPHPYLHEGMAAPHHHHLASQQHSSQPYQNYSSHPSQQHHQPYLMAATAGGHPPPHASDDAPSFATIQVQIPPVLMPGRQLMVHSPTGFPIPIVVPDHVTPGTVIPVQVPLTPPSADRTATS
jgi:Proline-rich nuclear receptor coactivator motif